MATQCTCSGRIYALDTTWTVSTSRTLPTLGFRGSVLVKQLISAGLALGDIEKKKKEEKERGRRSHALTWAVAFLICTVTPPGMMIWSFTFLGLTSNIFRKDGKIH